MARTTGTPNNPWSPLAKSQITLLVLLADGQEWRCKDMISATNFQDGTINKALKELVKLRYVDKICELGHPNARAYKITQRGSEHLDK